MTVSKFFLIFIFVVTLMFGSWYLYQQNDNKKIDEVINLVKTRSISVNFKTGATNKTLEEMIMFYNPAKKELTIGDIASTSTPNIVWSVNKVTEDMYRVRVKNPDNNCTYNFLVLTATKEVRADDRLAQEILNPNGY